MRKLMAVCLVALFALSFAGISHAAVDTIYEAAVISMKGEVKVDPNADGNWFTPWKGMKLKKGALLKVGEASSAMIVFDKEGLNVLSINANTQLTIDKDMVDMPDGDVIAKFENLQPGSSFTVKTPTAACAIRGSGMGVLVRGGKTTVKAFQHDVYVQPLDSQGNPKGSEKTLGEGKKLGIGQGGSVGDEEDLDDSDKEEFDDVEDGGDDTGIGEGEMIDTESEEEIDGKDLDEEKEISPSA